MAIILKDRVKVTSGVTGTGTVTLGAAADGFQDFSVIGNGNITYYTIALQSGNEWEVGKGTVTQSGGTWFLSRDTVYESSAGGTAVNFSAGTKDVFVTYPAERAIFEEPDGQTLVDGGPITVLGSGVTTNPSLEAELGKFVGNVDSFGQVYNLNQSDGSSASADFVVYNDLTTDGFTHFTDIGINSSNYSSVDYPLFTPGSGYVFHDGDDFFIGNQTAAKDVVLFAGGVDTANEAVRIKGSDQSVELTSDLTISGDQVVTGSAEFQSTVLLSADPTLALQAATKQYVDTAVSTGLHVHTPVRVATTANLTATYNNGSSGVGATLTNSGTQVALSVDGISLSVNDRVLVWQQTTQTQNGVYVVTTVGSGSTNWVLTRSSDADTYAAQDVDGLGGGDYFYVQEGLTGAGDSYICTNEGTITFGTTAITFSQFSGAITYTGGTNIDVTGQTISLTGTVGPTNGGTGVNTVTTGDLLYGSASNTWAKLPLGSAYKSLVVNGSGTQVEWNAVALNQSGAVSGTLPTGNGGTGLTSYTLGDILYSSATNTLARLPGSTSTTKLFLSQTGTGGGSAAPAWAQPTASDISGLAPSATTDTTNAANITSGTLPVARLNGSYTGITGVGTLAAGTWNADAIGATYGGTGQTSYTQGDLLYATSSTTVGKLADVASGNALLSGGVGADPAWGKVGLQTHVDGTLQVANGGTGATTLTGYVYGNGTGAMTASTTIPNSATTATSANTASAIVARDGSGNFSAGTITATLSGNASTATSATSATTATNLAGGVAGAVPYQTGSGATAFSAAGTTGQVLQSNGTSAPTWVSPTAVNNGTLTMAVSGTGLSGSATFTANQSGNSTFTVTSNATSLNNASTLVARDGSGNFSAGTITASLTGTASGNLPLTGGTLSGTLRFGDSTNGLYLSSGRLTVRSESADNVANFASYGLYLPVLGQTAGLYVESPIEARGGLRMGINAGNGTITVGADTNSVANRLVQRDGSGNFSAGTITATLNGNATTASSTPNPTFSGDAVSKDNITTRTDTGFYQTSSGTTANGWPYTTNTWQHLIACTHNNDSNYYSMQIAGGFFDQAFFGRKTNGSGSTSWVEFVTSDNVSSYAVSANGGTYYADFNFSGNVTANYLGASALYFNNPADPTASSIFQDAPYFFGGTGGVNCQVGGFLAYPWMSNGSGTFFRHQPLPLTISGNYYIAPPALIRQILIFTGGAATLTLPVGSDVSSSSLGFNYMSQSMPLTIINTGSGTATVVGSTNMTLTGSGSVPAGTSATFLIRCISAGSYAAYRT